jgi:hypothetical protein
VRLLVIAGRVGSIPDRRLASHTLANVIRDAIVPYSGRVVVQPRFFELIGRPESTLRRMRRWVERPTIPAWVHAVWPLTGFLISIAAASMILLDRPLIAAGLISCRIAVSAMLPTPGFASDAQQLCDRSAGDSDATRDWSVNWGRCVMGHFIDALLSTAIAGSLFLAGQERWGLVVSIVPLLVLTSTIVRLAAAQGGLVLDRLYAERVARNGVLVLGLVMAGFLNQGSGGTAALVLSTSGAAVYAMLEVVRTVTYSKRRKVIDQEMGRDEAWGHRVAKVVPLVDAAPPVVSPVGEERLVG